MCKRHLIKHTGCYHLYALEPHRWEVCQYATTDSNFGPNCPHKTRGEDYFKRVYEEEDKWCEKCLRNMDWSSRFAEACTKAWNLIWKVEDNKIPVNSDTMDEVT